MERIVFGLLVLAVSTCYAQQWAYVPAAVPINGQLTLECDSPTEAFDIYHKNIKVEQGPIFTVTKTTGKIEMTIKKVTEEYAGEYVCRTISNKEAKVSVSIRVSFSSDNKKTYSKTIGTKATVDLYVVGNPRPSIKYFKKNAGVKGAVLVEISSRGVVTKGSGGERFSIDSSKGYLIIDNVQSSDGGDYVVDAKSLGVLISETMSLVVGEKPKISTAPAKQVDLTDGESTTITCSFEKAPTTVKWTQTKKGGQKAEITAASTGNLILAGTNLKIVKAAIANEGDKFECFGENTFGNASASTMVNVVFVKPIIAPFATNNVKVVLNKDTSLSCTASGNPKPTVNWLKKGADGKYVALSSQTQAPGASTYNIVAAKMSDAGEYQCKAKLAGKPALMEVMSLTVALQIPPKIVAADTTTVQQYAVGKAQTKDLTCGATGSPLPSIMFMKAGTALTGAVEVSKDAKKIVMKIAYSANATADAGKIVCMAKSAIGNASSDITIGIIEMPPAPTGLKQVKVENSYVSLSWDAVVGATKYRISKDGAALKETVQNVDVKIEGLAGGQKYSFAVAAENPAGFGKYSAAVEVTTLKYGMPSIPQADPKNPTTFKSTEVTLKWVAPVSDGGDKDLSYVVKYCSPSGLKTYPAGNCKTVPSNTTSIVIKGLMENTKYQFTVSAKNARGVVPSTAFYATTGTRTGTKPTVKPKTSEPEPKAKSGLGGAAIAGIIVAVILILLIVIDLFCCFFNECGFTHCCYQACCAGKGKGKYAAAEDTEKAELKERQDPGNNHDAEVKTAPEEKEEKEPAKEKKSEDV